MEFGKVLNGVKIVELSTYAAAPAAARMLADWGADVIKVEGPGSDPMRAFSANACNTHTREENPIYQFENANKKGVALNLKNPEAMGALHKLLETADVFVTNTRLGSLTKLGLDYDALHAKYPRLVWAHVGGYGMKVQRPQNLALISPLSGHAAVHCWMLPSRVPLRTHPLGEQETIP